MKNSEKPKTPLVYMYAVQDIVAGRFFPPFTMENDQMAVRSFSEMANEQDPSRKSQIATHPGDFRLFKLADFDPSDGQIDSHAPMHLVNALELVQKTQNIQNHEKVEA